jgi:hypothetical protein
MRRCERPISNLGSYPVDVPSAPGDEEAAKCHDATVRATIGMEPKPHVPIAIPAGDSSIQSVRQPWLIVNSQTNRAGTGSSIHQTRPRLGALLLERGRRRARPGAAAIASDRRGACYGLPECRGRAGFFERARSGREPAIVSALPAFDDPRMGIPRMGIHRRRRGVHRSWIFRYGGQVKLLNRERTLLLFCEEYQVPLLPPE